MAKLSRDLSVGLLHPRENLSGIGNLAAANAAIEIDCDGCSTVSLDLRGAFSLTVQVQGTVDGTNWLIIPVRPQVGGPYVAGVVGAAAGVWQGACVGFRRVRAFVSAYTSGAAAGVLMASNAMFDDFAVRGGMTPFVATATAAVGLAATLSLPAPGLGLRQYLTYLRIVRFATAVLTPGAAPVIITTTNIPGALQFSMPADAAAQGTVFSYQEDFAYPIMGSAQNVAMTIVAPATPSVIWRVSAGYLNAP